MSLKIIFKLFSLISNYLAKCYGDGQITYTIQDDDKITTVVVDRTQIHLTEEASVAFNLRLSFLE